MELPELLWRMENVSVATRFPFMKTPKEPESTVWPGASFSGAAQVFAAKRMNNSPASHRRRVDPFIPNRSCMLPPPRPHRRLCRWCQPGTKPSDRKACAVHKARKTASHPATADAPADPAGNGEKALPPCHPEKTRALLHFRAMPRFRAARKLHRLRPAPAARLSTHSTAHPARQSPCDGIQPRPNHE